MKPMTIAALCAFACGLGALPGTTLAAQGDAPAGKPAQGQAPPGRQAYDRLVAEYEAAVAAKSAATQALMASEEWQQAAAAKDKPKLDALNAKVPAVDVDGMVQRAVKEADQFAGDDRVPLLCFAVLNGGRTDAATGALAKLRADHLKSPALVTLLERGFVVGRTLGQAGGEQFLDEVADANPDPSVRAFSMYWRGLQLQRLRDEASQQRGHELLTAAGHLAADTPYAEKIGAPLFEEQRLQIGMAAPDIEGADVDGTPFKLSDYRGKVVVLDFWGFW